jgi:hypothetical protein
MSESAPEKRYPCGCVSAWNEGEGRYTCIRRCKEHAERDARYQLRLALQQSHEEQLRRERAPLYQKPFRLLR